MIIANGDGTFGGLSVLAFMEVVLCLLDMYFPRSVLNVSKNRFIHSGLQIISNFSRNHHRMLKRQR